MNNYEDQEMEIESLQCIYLESEMKVTRERPYQIEVTVNSNSDDEEKNFLKLKVTFDLRPEYPDVIPLFRIKNLCTDYMDNKTLDKYEDEMKERARENLGNMMLYELCELLKEKITEINDEVVEKLERIEEAERTDNVLEKSKVTSDMTKMNYTPVNAETFAIWCEKYKERMRLERERNRKDWEDKPTGKELFLANKKAFEDITLDGEDEEEQKVEEEAAEEVKMEDEDEEEFQYDRALYDVDGLDDEDVDFDD